jgi:hypothetical protein
MARGALLLGCAIANACGDSPRDAKPLPVVVDDRVARLENTIARELAAKLSRDVKVACTPPARCVADLGDGKLPIALAPSKDGWTWRIDGKVVYSAPIEAYLRDMVRDLGVDQRISCGPPVHGIAPGERIACTLERGGIAFVIVYADGSFGVELSLDKASATARTTDVADKELTERSLASGGGDDDDD